MQQHKLADAERVQAEALELLTKSCKGEPDFDLAHAQFKLGDIQFQAGKTAVGEAAMRAGLAMTEALTGSKHKRVAELSARLAGSLAATKPAEAESLYRASVSTYVELGNPAQACTQSVALADLLLANSRPGDAEPVLVTALDSRQGTAGTARCAAPARRCAHTAITV